MNEFFMAAAAPTMATVAFPSSLPSSIQFRCNGKTPYLPTSCNYSTTAIKPNYIALEAKTTGTACTAVKEEPPILKQDGRWQINGRPLNILADITALCRQGQLKEALDILNNVDTQRISVSVDIYGFLLQTCSNKRALAEGKQVHTHIALSGLEDDVFLGTKLVTMYAICGSVVEARLVFDKILNRNVFFWTAMISGYVRNGFFREALVLYYQMRCAGIQSDNFTFSCVLKACAGLSALQQGQQIHNHIIRSEMKSDTVVDNTLVVMYAQCGRLEIARKVFDKISQRSLVSWSSMIAGCAQNGHANEALELFRKMQFNCVKLDWVVITAILPACGYLAALQQGKEIHGHMIRSESEPDVFVWNALIDMYAKCGCIEFARHVFDNMSEKDLVSWNTVIAGYGINGYGEVALALFHQMQQAGFMPNHITLIHILSACSHAGLVAEGWRLFNCMSQDFHIKPRVEHYACMVDLLGRSGRLDEAEKFIQNMPLEPSSSVWGSLLGACRIHCNIELGERVAERVFQIDPENNGYYVLLSNIYATAGRWDDVAKVRIMMKERGLKKNPGCSWIEVKNKVYAFVAGDPSPPQSKEIYAMLERLAGDMKVAGYIPATNFVLQNVEEKEKETFLCGHSEKLAIAFGLINTCSGAPIRIIKNLRVCGDCHSTTKFISKMFRREIILRDTNRFHHFKDGLCSCGDYW
eukprot:Gb_06176 [translate_table: standard]